MRNLLISIALLSAPSCRAATAAGFKSLFNGRDLTGWVYGRAGGGVNKSGAGYQAKNGVLYCTKTDGGNLFTENEYGDFILTFEFRLTPNANNGIGIRSPLEGDAAYAGMEIQVLDDSGSEYRNLKEWQVHGSIYNVVAAKRGALAPVGAWNREEITANGPRVIVKVNDQTVVDADLSKISDPETLRKHPGLARTRGRIGFLGHGARVEFRNIHVKELKDPRRRVSAAESP